MVYYVGTKSLRDSESLSACSEEIISSGLHLNKVGTFRLARNFLDFLKNEDQDIAVREPTVHVLQDEKCNATAQGK